ncbi:hypothetical protein EVAR_82899_1 [Eumeta japonica]|uniref:Uncharacterized protein n=1 Tax=Eumeta variegata TaxID=151549 RepID=A0A4C1YKQ7_EUMVA|nr:hypothetical protein EVAR_82899_1 [Eumeta japonica]
MGQRACEPPENKWLSSPMNTRNLRVITIALPASGGKDRTSDGGEMGMQACSIHTRIRSRNRQTHRPPAVMRPPERRAAAPGSRSERASCANHTSRYDRRAHARSATYGRSALTFGSNKKKTKTVIYIVSSLNHTTAEANPSTIYLRLRASGLKSPTREEGALTTGTDGLTCSPKRSTSGFLIRLKLITHLSIRRRSRPKQPVRSGGLVGAGAAAAWVDSCRC